MIKFLLLSMSFWVVVYFVSVVPDKERLESLKQRGSNLQLEINKIDDNFKYLKAEREDLLENDRFYIRKLSREKLRLALQPESSVSPSTSAPLKH
jgi:hypothetical protein